VPQLVVVIEVFGAQCQRKHPLADQGRDFVLDQIRCAVVGKTVCKTLDQPDRPIGGAKQQGPGIRGHPPAVKPRHYRAPRNRCKTTQTRGTLCRHRDSP
jgi:hypothetical protein